MISIVDVEGLDAFGKTCFCKNIVSDLNAVAPDNIRFIYQHFPEYCSETGEEIKDFLFNEKNPFSEIAIRYMIELQMRNRLEWWLHSWEYLNAKEYDQTVVIADRFTASNAIYQFWRLPDSERWMEYYREMEYKRFRTVIPSFNIFCTCPVDLQEKRLKKRKNKDNYEALEMQREYREHYYDMARKFAGDNYFWLPMELLDGEYVTEKFFSQWEPDSIAKEIRQIYLHAIIVRMNTKVLKSKRHISLKMTFNRDLKNWVYNYIYKVNNEIEQGVVTGNDK